MFPRYSHVLLLVGLLAMTSPQAGTLGEDEIQLVSRPYSPPPRVLFPLQVFLVAVPVVVRDAKGLPVGGLQPKDFQIFDSGKLQAVDYFSLDTSHRTPFAEPPTPTPPQVTASGQGAPAARQTPRFVALFFDDVNSRLGDMVAARTAAQKFIRESMEPRDRMGIFTSSSTVTLEFTGDKDMLLASLARIQTHERRSDEGPASCPRISPLQAHLIINLHDPDALELGIAEGMALGCIRSRREGVAVVTTRSEYVLSLAEQFSVDTLGKLSNVIQYLAKVPGDRMLVLASAGFFTRTYLASNKQDKLIDEALRAGIVINSLDAKGLTAEPPGGDLSQGRPVALIQGNLMAYADMLRTQQREANNDPMSLLAEGTGGRFFHNNNDLGGGLRNLAADPEISYLIGFSPKNLKADGRFHELKVKLDNSRGLTVQARRGYYAPTQVEQAKEGLSAKFNSQAFTTAALSDFPARVTAEPGKLDSGEPVLKLALHVDVRGVHFERRAGRNMARLRCVIVLFDKQENYLAGLEADLDLALKEETLARLAPTGLYQHLTLQAPPGSYRLRAVIQEQARGQMATINQSVVIP